MKLLRIETRSRQVRFVSLAPFPNLAAWIGTMRRDGWCVGDIWGMPFDEIALVDVVDAPDQEAERQNAASEAQVHSLGQAIALGRFKPGVE